MKKIKNIIIYSLVSLALFYVFNVILYFLVFRQIIIDGAIKLYESKEGGKVFESHGMSKEELISRVLVDESIFSPLFNFAYSIGNKSLGIISGLLVLGFLIYFLKKNSNS